MSAARRRFRLLLMTSDMFPPFRPAAKSIFGDEFAARGHVVDWLLRPDPRHGVEGGARPFGRGTAYVARTDTGESRRRRFRKHWLAFVNDCRALTLVRRGGYDLVQVKDKYLGALLAIAACKLFGVPLFYWIAFPHSESALYNARNAFARYRWLYLLRGALQKWTLYRLILPCARHVFVQSEQMRRDMAAEGVPIEKMTPVPSSLNLAALDASAGGVEKPPNERWIVYLGTLLRQRQLDFLVRVLARVIEREPDARLLFVGKGGMGADERALIEEARRLGVSHAVTITGWLDEARAWDYTRAADVCVSPYAPIPVLRSTSPTKLIEYMALSRPVVASVHPEQTPILRDSGAGLLADWNEDEFAAAIVHVLRHPDDAAEMGRAGRRFVERFRTHRRMADLVEETYARILSTDHPGTAGLSRGPRRSSLRKVLR